MRPPHENALSLKERIGILSLVLPMASRWLIPASLEKALTPFLFGFLPLYLPDLLLLLFWFWGHPRHALGDLKALFLFQCAAAATGLLLNTYSDKPLSAFCNLHYFAAVALFLWRRPSPVQLQVLRLPLTGVLLLLAVEILLYSVGTLQYDLDITGVEYGAVSRIRTTIGAATGSSLILLLLGAVAFALWKDSPWRFALLPLWVAPIFMLVSKGAILALALAAAWNLARRIVRGRHKIRHLLLAGFAVALLWRSGLLVPMWERIQLEGYSDVATLASQRDLRIQDSLAVFRENPLFGVGLGNVFGSKEYRYDGPPETYQGAPHNVFVLVLVEQGLLGLLAFLSLWGRILWRAPGRDTLLHSVLCMSVLVCFNTEAIVMVDSEYLFLLMLALMVLDEEYAKRPTNPVCRDK